MAEEILERWIDVGGIKTHHLTAGNGGYALAAGRSEPRHG